MLQSTDSDLRLFEQGTTSPSTARKRILVNSIGPNTPMTLVSRTTKVELLAAPNLLEISKTENESGLAASTEALPVDCKRERHDKYQVSFIQQSSDQLRIVKSTAAPALNIPV